MFYIIQKYTIKVVIDYQPPCILGRNVDDSNGVHTNLYGEVSLSNRDTNSELLKPYWNPNPNPVQLYHVPL